MEEQQLIQKGFNHGYFLQKHQPELAQQLQEGFKDPSSAYARGFSAGSAEYSKEQALENYNPPLPSKSTEKDLGKDRGLDI